MWIVGEEGLYSQSRTGLKDAFGQALNSPVPIGQKTVDTLREGSGFEVFIVDNI